MGLDPADDNLSLRRKAVMTTVQFHDFPLVNQGAQGPAQFFPARRIYVKGLGDIGEGESLVFSSPNDA